MRPRGNESDPNRIAWLEEALQVARSGSKEALGKIFEEFRHYLSLVANKEIDADLRAKAGGSDLVQQTFMEAQRDFPAFRGTTLEEFQHWLRGILLHNIAGLKRDFRDTAKRDVALERSIDKGSSTHGFKAKLITDTPSPSGHVMIAEQLELLKVAIERLPEQYRQAIVLHHRENLGFEEVGRRLGRSADAARKLWARAIETLHNELKSSLKSESSLS